MCFKGKVVLVTGASSGIGAATAISFAAEGAQVTMVGRNQTKLDSVAATCEQRGSKPLVIVADVTKSEDITRIMSETLARFERLDVLVNSAGVLRQAGILAPDALAVHEQTMATNLQAAVHLTHLAAPHLVLTKGTIINISGIGSTRLTMENSFSCLVSKAGLDHFTRAIALELAPKGVRVNVVNPGAVRTDILESLGVPKEQKDAVWKNLAQVTPMKRVAEPEEIADLILFLASEKAKSITGSSFVVDNGALLTGIPPSNH